jgi:hypothetical protein
MIPAALDECLFYSLSRQQQQHPATALSALDGVAGLLVDDTLMTGSARYRTDETAMHSQFQLSAERETSTFSYGGVSIRLESGTISATQAQYALDICAGVLAVTFADIQSTRGKFLGLLTSLARILSS